VQDVNQLLKQFDETRKMMKVAASGKNLGRMLGNTQGRRN